MPEWIIPLGWVVGPVVTGVIGVLIGNHNRSFDARREAEASLIKAGPDIIDRLNTEIGKLWLELRTTQAGERECRNELWLLKQRIGRIDGQDG